MKQLPNESYADYYERLLNKSLNLIENDINECNYELIKGLLQNLKPETLEDYVNFNTVNIPFYIK